MNKILISDFDGTLYTSRNDFLENVKKIEKFRKNGNLFVLATGRSINDLKKVLDGDYLPYDYLILNHGTLIIDSKGQIFNEKFIEDSIVKNIFEIAMAYSDYIVDKKFYTANKKDASFGDGPINKVLFDIESINQGIAQKFYDEVMNEYGNFLSGYILKWENCDEIEFLPKDVDKTKQINYIIKKENIEKTNVYTIGDGINDIEMLKDYKGASMIKSSQEVLNLNLKQYCTVSEFILDIEDNKI